MTFDDLWETLTHIRRDRRTYVSQYEMARRMDTSQSHISDVEKETRTWSEIDILERYANAMGYVIVYDLKRVEEME